MNRSCAAGLIFFGVFGVIYYAIIHLYTNLPSGVDFVMAAACGGFALLFLSGVVGLLTSGQQSAAFKRAESSEPLQDGRLEVITGAAQTTGEPLISPLQQVPCVAYTYKISHTRTYQTATGQGSNESYTTNTTTVTDYSGYGLGSALIKSTRGEVALRGFFDLSAFDDTVDQAAALVNARAYVASAPLQEVGLVQSLTAVAKLVNETHAAVRVDLHVTKGDLEPGRALEESTVRVGQQITGFGHYSASQMALVPQATWNFTADSTVRLFKGDAQAAKKKIGGSKLIGLLFSVLGLAVTHLVLFASLR